MENDKIFVKELGEGEFQITLGEMEFKLLSKHAKESNMPLNEYLVSVFKDYVEILSDQI